MATNKKENVETKANGKEQADGSSGLGTKINLSFKRIGGYFVAALIDFRRSPLTIFFSIAYPVILILLFGAIFSEETQSFQAYTLYIQSKGDSGFQPAPFVQLNFTNDILTILQEMETIDNESVFEIHNVPLVDNQNNPIDPAKYLEEQEGYICLVFPRNFTQKVLFSPPANLTIIMDENSQSAMIASDIINSVVYNFNLVIAGEDEIRIGMETFDIFLEEEIEYLDFFIPGMIAVTIMNNAVIGTINRYTYFRNQGFFKKLAASPIKKGEVVTGEASWQFIQATISVVATLIIAWTIFKLPRGDFDWIIRVLDWRILPTTIAGVMGFTGLGMIGSRLIKDTDAATAAGNFLTFPMMFLSGAFFDVSGIPGLNIVSKFLPLTYVVDALRASMITQNNPIAWRNLGISFGIGIILLAIGIIITKLTEE